MDIYICNIQSNTDLNIDDIRKNDIDNGYTDIMCHFLITLYGEIIEVNKLGTDILNLGRTNYIIIRYVYNNPCFTTIIPRSIYFAMYSIIYKIYELNNYKNKFINILDGNLLSDYFKSNLPMYFYFNRIDMLLNMNKNAFDKYTFLKNQIKQAEITANDLIENNVYTSKTDIENSKYNKLYKLGIKRYKTIMSKHFNNDNELIECVPVLIPEYTKQLYKFIHNSSINKTLYDSVIEKCNEKQIYKPVIFETLYRECGFVIKKNRDNVICKDNKYYIHMIILFRAWSIIKETIPISKTQCVIKKYKNQNDLNKTELKELLAAYILLSEEAKTIKDYDGNNLLKEIYDKIMSGTYISGLNYVNKNETYQINRRVLYIFLFRNLKLNLKND